MGRDLRAALALARENEQQWFLRALDEAGRDAALGGAAGAQGVLDLLRSRVRARVQGSAPAGQPETLLRVEVRGSFPGHRLEWVPEEEALVLRRSP